MTKGEGRGPGKASSVKKVVDAVFSVELAGLEDQLTKVDGPVWVGEVHHLWVLEICASSNHQKILMAGRNHLHCTQQIL